MKLIDFGLAEIVYPGDKLKTMCGTPLYCSPEVLFLHLQGRTGLVGFEGGPADVWSIGVLIFALLTGCAPFDDSNFQRLRHEVSRRSIAYPAHLSARVKGLLKLILVADPHMRPTVKDLLNYEWFQVEESPKQVESKVEAQEVEETPESIGDDKRRVRSFSTCTEGTSSAGASLEDACKVEPPCRGAVAPTHSVERA